MAANDGGPSKPGQFRPSFDEVRGAIGSLLLLWSDVERAARQEIAQAGSPAPKPGAGFIAILNEWVRISTEKRAGPSLRSEAAQALRVRLEEDRQVRNGICHCLTGYSAGGGGCAATYTWTIDGEARSMTYEELQAALNWLAGVPRALAVIARSSADGSQSRLTDNPENRGWWKSEFGIDLPTQS